MMLPNGENMMYQHEQLQKRLGSAASSSGSSTRFLGTGMIAVQKRGIFRLDIT